MKQIRFVLHSAFVGFAALAAVDGKTVTFKISSGVTLR
jgi:hypothetical protein